MARKSDNAALNYLADAVTGSEGARLLRTDAVVSVDTMSLSAEMKTDSGHDLYEAENVTQTADLAVSFDAVTGLVLAHVQSVENKTKGWIYSTKGATVTTTAITLVAANQKTGYPVIAAADEVEVIYRGESRLTNKTQMSKITDGTNELFINSDGQLHAHSFGVYNATDPTLTDGSIASLQLDTSGNLKTNVTNASLAVTGTFWQATQPISGAVTTDVDTTDLAKDTTLEKLKMHSGTSVVMAVDQVLTTDWVATNNITTRNVSGYNRIGVFVEATPNDSENGQIRVVGELGSGNLYEIDGLSEKTVFTTGAFVMKYYEFDIGTLTDIRIQVKVGTLGVTAGQMSIYLNEAYRY